MLLFGSAVFNSLDTNKHQTDRHPDYHIEDGVKGCLCEAERNGLWFRGTRKEEKLEGE